MTKSNGIKSLKQAAKLLNKHAPDGESLAYINPEEAKLLRSHGGSGIQTLQGVPSYISLFGWDVPGTDWLPWETGTDVLKTFTDPYKAPKEPVYDKEGRQTNKPRSIVQDAMSIWVGLRAKKEQEGLNAAEMEQFNKLNQQLAAAETEFDVSTDFGAQLTAPDYTTDVADVAAYTPKTFNGQDTPDLTIDAGAEGGRIGAFNGGIQGLMPQQGLDPRIGFNSGGIDFSEIFSANDLFVLRAHKYDPAEVATWKDKGKGLLSVLRNPNAQGGRIGYGLGTRTGTATADPNRVVTGDPRDKLLSYFSDKYSGNKQVSPSSTNYMTNLISQVPVGANQLTSGQGSQFQLLTEYQNYVTEVGEENAVPFEEWQASRMTAAYGGRIGYDIGGLSGLSGLSPQTEQPYNLMDIKTLLNEVFNEAGGMKGDGFDAVFRYQKENPKIFPEGFEWGIQEGEVKVGKDPMVWTDVNISKAQGGRIGYGIGSLPINSQPQGEESIKMAGTDTPPIEMENLQDLLSAFYEAFGRYPTSIDELKGWARNKTQAPQEEVIRGMAAYGGRIGYAGGNQVLPLLDLGGQEKDYREDGGFVPIGRKEKADDVPARLSKNEFVFTADAVRAAGGGDIDEGAQRMYNVMKNLEAGGEISQETQGKA